MLGTIVRFIVSALVLQLTAFLVPGFAVGGFLGALIAAVVISLVGWAIERVFQISPRSRGFVGFIVSATTLYVAQFIVPTIEVTLLGSLIASLVIGLIDAFVPVEVR